VDGLARFLGKIKLTYDNNFRDTFSLMAVLCSAAKYEGRKEKRKFISRADGFQAYPFRHIPVSCDSQKTSSVPVTRRTGIVN